MENKLDLWKHEVCNKECVCFTVQGQKSLTFIVQQVCQPVSKKTRLTTLGSADSRLKIYLYQDLNCGWKGKN